MGFSVSAQETETDDSTIHVIDELQVDVKSARLDEKGDTLTIDLFLISYQRNPREFKLNTFATQIVDSRGESHLCTSIKMGRVTVQLADRQNYLHYLLEEDNPVPLSIKVGDWQDKKPQKIRLVFEDSTEQGKYITEEVDL